MSLSQEIEKMGSFTPKIPKKVRVFDLLKEQELLECKYFTDDVAFVVPVEKGEDTEYLKEQIKKHHNEVQNALARYLEIDNILNEIYAKHSIEVMGYQLSLATGIEILKRMQNVEREPLTGKLIFDSHPIGIYLSMCTVPYKFNYSNEPILYLDPLKLESRSVIESVTYKINEFLIELRFAIENAKNEIELNI